MVVARSDPPIVRALTAGGLYFLIAFAAGFVFGAIRELAVTPRMTSDLAIVLEAPVMAVVVWFAAGFSVRQLDVPRSFAFRLPMGVLALGLMLGAEDILTRVMRGGSLLDHWATFGLLATGTILASLFWFTLAPVLIKASSPSQAQPHV